MIISTCLLASYGYLLHLEYENISGETEFELIESEDNDILQIKDFASRKQEKIVNIQLQWILNSILVIFALSICDFSDVYNYFNAKNYIETSKSYLNNAQLFKKLSDNNLILLNQRDNNIDKLDLIKNEIKTLNYTKDFFLEEENNFYKSFIKKRNAQSIRYSHDGTDLRMDHYQVSTNIKILFYFKVHSRLLNNVLIVIFSFIILYKMRSVEKLTLSGSVTNLQDVKFPIVV